MLREDAVVIGLDWISCHLAGDPSHPPPEQIAALDSRSCLGGDPFPYGGVIFYFIVGTDRLVRQKLRATREMDASGGRAERRVNADTPRQHRAALRAGAPRRGVTLTPQ